MMYLVLVVMCFSATGMGFLIGALSNSVEMSSALATAFIMPILAFSGVVVNNSTLPVWFRWIQYLSPTRFAFEGLCIAEWGNTPLKVVYEVNLGFGTKINYWDCLIAMGIIAFLFRIFALICLKAQLNRNFQ